MEPLAVVAPAIVDAASDARMVNNVMRHAYRVLSDAEKAQMKLIKDKGLEFVEFLQRLSGYTGEGPAPENFRLISRELSVAQTKIEEAVMWAVKHITR